MLPKVQMAIEWLKKNDAEPTTRGNANGRASGAMPESKICPVHHVAMRLRHGKGGDSWYSHKAINPDTNQEYWCRGGQN